MCEEVYDGGGVDPLFVGLQNGLESEGHLQHLRVLELECLDLPLQHQQLSQLPLLPNSVLQLLAVD